MDGEKRIMRCVFVGFLVIVIIALGFIAFVRETGLLDHLLK